ncbi:MAG: 5-formyltetrahydrofolate cyclo-ligase [Kofleriaceae bacterium]|nr:5-formyltetrahydrofolate cyclo-ligase [Kofleriaceae bacterium]
MQKPITRRTVLLRRDMMPEAERAAASTVIADEVLALLARLPVGSIIGLYAPKGTEVDTARIDVSARARGLVVAYPRVEDGIRRLSFHATTIDALVPGAFGLREPVADARTAVELSEIAAFAIPGLAFDRAGGRIGWGRGYYDVTLATVPQAIRIGLAFECQIIDAVPHDPHDIRLHHVVTEAAVYRAPD